MASIQSLGIGSGLLTSELADNIIGAERAATDLRLDAKRTELGARISALGSLKSNLTELRGAAFALNVESAYTATTSTASGSGATARTTATAVPGSHLVEVNQLARAHTLASRQFADPLTEVGTGTLSIRFGTTSYVGDAYDGFAVSADSQQLDLTIDASNSSLTGIRDSINAANAGVTANIVNDGTGYRLVLTSTSTGEAQSMEIAVTEGAVPGLSALAYNASANDPLVNMEETIRAQDAQLEVDGIAITRASNAVADVVEGVTFDITAVNSGSPATISISRDTEDLVGKVEDFLDKYNGLRDLVDDLAGFDADAGVGGLLMGDAAVRSVMTQLRRVLTDVVGELGGTSRRSLAEMGITSDQNDSYKLKLDSSVFLAALADAPQQTSALFTDRGLSSDTLIRYSNDFPETVAGNYAVTVDRLASRGFVEGSGGLSGPFVIDANNDSLTLSVDGTSSAALQLAAGSYADGAALAAEIQRQVNADDNLRDAGAAVTVSFESASSAFRITSNRWGAESQVAVDAVDTATLATLGLAVDDGTANRGVDVTGTINGVRAYGVGRSLSLTEPGTGPGTPGTPDTPATSGYYEGTPSAFASGPVTINNGNRNLRRISVDGIETGTVRMTKQTYATGADLAAELQAKINADGNLQAAGKTVTVTYNPGNHQFRFSSDSTGSTSSIEFTNVPIGTENTLGTTEGFGPLGTDLIPGTPAVPGETGPDPSDNDAYGLSVEVLGGPLGARGSIALTSGVVSQFVEVLNNALAFDGIMNDRLGGLEAQLNQVEEDASAFDARMLLLEERLKSQFAVADAMIAQLNSTSDYISQQFAALPVFNQKDN